MKADGINEDLRDLSKSVKKFKMWRSSVMPDEDVEWVGHKVDDTNSLRVRRDIDASLEHQLTLYDYSLGFDLEVFLQVCHLL